jgi:hypothetical protein
MSLDWIWQNFFSQVVWEILLILGGGVFLSYLRTKMPRWGPAIQNAVFSMAAIAVIIYGLTGRAIFSAKPPTAENIGALVRMWAEDTAVSIRKVSDPRSKFSYDLKFPNGAVVNVVQRADQPSYLFIHSTIIPDEQAMDKVGKLNQEQIQNITENIVIELAKTNVEFNLEPLNHMTIVNRVLITDTLTQGYFYQQVEAVNNADLIAMTLLKSGARKAVRAK